MPYQLEWRVPDRVIAIRVTDELALNEIETGSRELIPLLDAGIAPVHICIDISPMRSYPFRVSTLADSSKYLRHQHVGWLVICGVSSLVLEQVIAALAKLTRVRCRIVSSKSEAFRFLADQDPTVAERLIGPDLSSSD